MTNFLTFLEGLIITSEKAAQISRIIRLAYLTADGANPIATENKDLWESHSSSTDFKTLADVLCQSVIDTDLQHLVCIYCTPQSASQPLLLNQKIFFFLGLFFSNGKVTIKLSKFLKLLF